MVLGFGEADAFGGVTVLDGELFFVTAVDFLLVGVFGLVTLVFGGAKTRKLSVTVGAAS